MSPSAIIGTALGAPTLVALIWLICRAWVRTIVTERPDLASYGDVPNIPSELTAARNQGAGGYAATNGGQNAQACRTHVGGGI